MLKKELVQIVEYRRFTKAQVQEIRLGDRAVYRVVDPGRLDGRPILDYRKTYSMEKIFQITEQLNKAVGRVKPSTWAVFVDQV